MSTHAIHSHPRSKVDIAQEVDVTVLHYLPGQHRLLERQLARQRPAGTHRVLVVQPGASQQRADDKRDKDRGVVPVVGRTSPRESEDHEPEAEQEQELSADIDARDAPGELLTVARMVPVQPGDGLGPEEVPPEEEEDDGDADEGDGQVDREAPPPVGGGEVAADDGADAVAYASHQGEERPVLRVLL